MSNTSKAGSANSENLPSVKKIGLVRFLQLCPQKRGIEALLQSKYAVAVKTETEWKSAVDQILHSKAK